MNPSLKISNCDYQPVDVHREVDYWVPIDIHARIPTERFSSFTWLSLQDEQGGAIVDIRLGHADQGLCVLGFTLVDAVPSKRMMTPDRIESDIPQGLLFLDDIAISDPRIVVPSIFTRLVGESLIVQWGDASEANVRMGPVELWSDDNFLTGFVVRGLSDFEVEMLSSGRVGHVF